MLDARTAWVSVGSSRSDVQLDSTSSASLLHSIYGSQASQLQFSDYDSETSLQANRSEHRSPQPSTHRLLRPKSSPAAVIAAREQLRRQRPGSAAVRSSQQRGRGSRPASAVPRRPSSALGGRPAGLARSRPKTALGLHRSPPILLEDLEEEKGDNPPPAIKDISTPVKLTHVPEYFDFWAGKPLLRKEFGVPTQKRKQWQRPKSDYGNRFFKKGNSNLGADHMGRGTGLETLVERDDSTLGSEGDGKSRRGSLLTGGDGASSGDGLGVVGERMGEGDDDDRLRRGGKGDGDGNLGDKLKRSLADDRNKNDDRNNKDAAWDETDGTNHAEDDEYFKKKAMASLSWLDGGGSSNKSTRFELPMDIKELEAMSPLVYLNKHCIVSDRRMKHCSRIFTKLDRDKDHCLKQQEVVAGLTEAQYNCITEEQAAEVLAIVEMPPDFLADLKVFAALCCLTERVHSLFYFPIAGREVIEVVDFEALDWKLRDCTISDSLRMLFAKL